MSFDFGLGWVQNELVQISMIFLKNQIGLNSNPHESDGFSESI
jgi:hypothetical protein